MGAGQQGVRREGNQEGAGGTSRRQRMVPLDFVTVQAFDTYEFERMRVPRAAGSDFVLVNLFREPAGAPMRLDAVNDLVTAASRPAGLEHAPPPPHMVHPFAPNGPDPALATPPPPTSPRPPSPP